MKVQISDSIKYIGIDDTDIDLFESQYAVPEGVSYNSYVILDEKVAVIDTVDLRKQQVWEENLHEILQGRTVDYLIIQHLEPDHAGGIKRMLAMFPEIVLVGNQKTFLFLEQFIGAITNEKKLVIKEADTLILGQHSLQFYMAHMVHWPEVFVTYESTERILFSADAFGRFGAIQSAKEEDWARDARRYYFNIVGKYGIAVQALLKKIEKLKLQRICPAHGTLLEQPLERYLTRYDIWSRYKPETKGVFLVYGSFHGNTRAVAEYMAKELQENGVQEVLLKDAARTDMAELVAYAFQYECMLLVAASYDAGVFPQIMDLLNRLKSKGYQKRKIGIVENGTWSPSAGRMICSMLACMNEIQVIEPMVTIYSVMTEENKGELNALISKFTNK